jgi:cytoskeletal protein RodZ
MDIGSQLRAAREAHGLSLVTLAQRTRVPERALAAIERNDASALPPHPFGRGFVRTYAAEVDLDPDRLVRDYFAQFPQSTTDELPPLRTELPDTSWEPQSRWMGLATALAILAVVVAAAVVLGRRGDTTGDAQAVGTAGDTPAAPAASAPQRATAPTAADRAAAAPAAIAPAAPQPAPTSQARIAIALSVSRPCWVAATVDGHRTIYRIMEPGERATLEGHDEVTLRFGDAGAVSWTINGRDPGAPGADGAVRTARITPENAVTAK